MLEFQGHLNKLTANTTGYDNANLFRFKVQGYCKRVGKRQKALAYLLGYKPSSFSEKLYGTDNAVLTPPEIKLIIKTLAEWQAINYRLEAVELLNLKNLTERAFTQSEWNTYPLNQLDYQYVTSLNLLQS